MITMTNDELRKARDWANEKIATGSQPPWAWYQYMKLRETLDAILEGRKSTSPITVPEDSPLTEQRQGNGYLRLVQTDQPDSAQPDQDTVSVPLPM